MAKNFWTTLKEKIPYLFLIFGGAFLYLYKLDKVPVHLNQDELMFSLNAYSISKNLHDYYGNFLPFYFWHLGSFWATPIVVYWASLFLKFLPLTEAAIRAPSVFVTLISAGLLMVLVEKIFKDKRLTIISGILFLTTPALFINSRLLMDIIYPIPFVILWLVLMYRYIKIGSLWHLFFSSLALGVGTHSYHAAKIMMPIYFLATAGFYFRNFWANKKSFLVFALGFLLPIILFIPWLKVHPDTLLNQVSYIGSIDKSVNVEKGIRGVFNLNRFSNFANSYISYFGPKILFTEGDRSLIHSTKQTGAFLFPVVFLLGFGIIWTIARGDVFSRLILFGFLTYPVAPAVVDDPQRISRGLILIPFVVILSTYGLFYLLNSKDKILRGVAIGLTALGILQFSFFLTHYFGSYKKESYAWFNYDIGGALESALRSTKIREVDRVYLDEYIPFVGLYFKFYETKLGTYAPFLFYNFQRQDFTTFPKGSLIVLRSDHSPGREDNYGDFERIEIIREPDGNESFYIYYRDR